MKISFEDITAETIAAVAPFLTNYILVFTDDGIVRVDEDHPKYKQLDFQMRERFIRAFQKKSRKAKRSTTNDR